MHGISNNYHTMSELENTDHSDWTKSEVRYLYAKELRKKKPLFDGEAMDKLFQGLVTRS